MRPIRYIGLHRNAGYGYSFIARCRREAAYFVAFRLGLYRLGYLIDFDRDRFLEEYIEVEGLPASSIRSGGAGSPRECVVDPIPPDDENWPRPWSG